MRGNGLWSYLILDSSKVLPSCCLRRVEWNSLIHTPTIKRMKTNKLLLNAAIGLLASVFFTSTAVYAASASIKFASHYFVVTAPTSTNNPACLQNVMDSMDPSSGGYLVRNTRANNPTVVNSPGIWRVSQTIYGPANLYLHDATNNPSGIWAGENGERLGWGTEAWDATNTFLASDIYFRISSTDNANTLNYPGNIATNTSGGAGLNFSPTLRGELWTNGTIISYNNGESVAGHPVNRVVCLIRLGYFVNNMSEVALDLNYFKNHLHMTNFAAFYAKDGNGNVVAGHTNYVTTYPHPVPSVVVNHTSGQVTVDVEGQRQLGLSYLLWRQVPICSTNPWVQVGVSAPEGFFVDNQVFANAGYMASEGPTPPAPSSLMLSQAAPTLQVFNGPE